MLDEGEKAPSFSLPGAHGGEVDRFALGDYAEDVVVLCFFPGAFNPHCREGCWLEDVDLLTLQRNVSVLGVGPDTAYSNREFAEEVNVDFPLLSDTGGDVAAAYGVLREQIDGHRQIPTRAVFVLDDRQQVTYRWVADDLDDVPRSDAIREAIGGVKSDGTAVERYRDAHDYARYGREEFHMALDAYEAGDWGLAREAFVEAAGYFEDAAAAAGSARWFAADDALVDRLGEAKDRLDHFLRAARWYRESAGYRAEGADDLADEYREDAREQRDRAESQEPLPDPDDLTLDGDSGVEVEA